MSAKRQSQLVFTHGSHRRIDAGTKGRRGSPSSGPNDLVIWIRANNRNDIVKIVITPKTTDTVVTVGP